MFDALLRFRIRPGVALLAVLIAGCTAVYPELGTRMRKPAEGQALSPPAPEELRWIKFVGARVPPKTRDGRTWDQVLGSLPDPYAKLMVNGKEILRTPIQGDTLEPTWPNGPSGNFRIVPEDKLRVELWDDSPLNDQPIGVRDIGNPTDEQRSSKQIRTELEGGGEVTIAFEPAHAMLGLGLWFELRTDTCFITRTLDGSPAQRAGVRKGDQVLRIAGRDASALSSDEIRTAFNGVPAAGLPLDLKHEDGSTLSVVLVEGPIYPTYAQVGALD